MPYCCPLFSYFRKKKIRKETLDGTVRSHLELPIAWEFLSCAKTFEAQILSSNFGLILSCRYFP